MGVKYRMLNSLGLSPGVHQGQNLSIVRKSPKTKNKGDDPRPPEGRLYLSIVRGDGNQLEAIVLDGDGEANSVMVILSMEIWIQLGF